MVKFVWVREHLPVMVKCVELTCDGKVCVWVRKHTCHGEVCGSGNTYLSW